MSAGLPCADGPRRVLLRALLAGAGIGVAGPREARAGTRLVDLSAPRQARVRLEWAPITSRGDDGLHRMSARVPDVEYLLETAAYVGRAARISYVIPLVPGLVSPLGLLVRWTARGALRSGQGRAGDRVAVFEGRIAEPRMAAWFDLALEVDSRYFDGRLSFEPFFEIDVQ